MKDSVDYKAMNKKKEAYQLSLEIEDEVSEQQKIAVVAADKFT